MQSVAVGDTFRVVKDGVEYEFEAAEEGGYIVRVPAYPSALSEGDTFEEALFYGQDALRECLLAARDLGLEIPAELEHVIAE
jgi:predicted RNase H-like HicB family nuclease